MVRVKRGTTAHKRRKKVLKHTKGFRWGRKSKFRLAKQALQKAWTYAYRDRKVKKRTFRRLWQVRIGAALRQLGFSYNKFIHALKENHIELDRKILASLAKEKPEVFEKIVKSVFEKKEVKTKSETEQ
jgi:large subunit ribosomal protein L20